MSANPHLKAGCLGLLLMLVGCSGDRQRTEARALLALYEGIDHREPAATREPKIKKLSELTLTDDLVSKARSECVSAHQALLTAERQHEAAARELDKALEKSEGGEPLPPAVTVEIQHGIDKADSSLTDARIRFERCENQVRSLSLRFGKN